jgi:5-methyltetrahydropteroyltriglutamate--homocysteine methyltransferase
VDIDHPGTALDRSGHPNPVPRIVGPVRRKHAVGVEDVRFLRAHTDRPIKMTVPGPFTMAQQAQNDYYPSEEAAALDYAIAVNEEIRDLFAAGADVVQVDEPYMQARPDKARQFGLKALGNRALDGISGRRRYTSASVTPPSSTSGRRATRSCPSWPAVPSRRCRSRRRRPGSTARC